MSFVRSAFAATPLFPRWQYVRWAIDEAKAAGFTDWRGAAVCAVMCMLQEAGADPHYTGKRQIWNPGNTADPCYAQNPGSYPHDSESDDGRSVGCMQQQMNAPGTKPWGWGGNYGDCGGTLKRMTPQEAIRMFYTWPGSGLQFKNMDASSAQAANDSIQRVQGSGVPNAYAQWWGEANTLVDQALKIPSGGDGGVVSGDPIWLEDVLRPVLGGRLKTIDGWQGSGTGGEMRQIWGVIWHHTGNAKASAQSIRDGRPDLAGPLSQLHMAQDGTVTIVAVGPCNHAGPGSWAGLPTDDANDRTIGIEMAWPRDLSITEATQRREDWPPVMIKSMIDVGAALALKIGMGFDHNISHSEWARFGPAGWRQGKWDPGNLNMEWLRFHIRDRMAELQGQPMPPPPPPVLTDRQLLELIYADVAEIRAQLGRGHPSWNPIVATERPGVQLTMRDAVDVLVERGNIPEDHVLVEHAKKDVT